MTDLTKDCNNENFMKFFFFFTKLEIKLRKLYQLNKINQKKKNDNLYKLIAESTLLIQAYAKVYQKNKKYLTMRSKHKIVDIFKKIRLKIIQKNLKENRFVWKPIRKKIISKLEKNKKKRLLDTINFDNKIVQELIRIVLNILYEPVFQKKEYNHSFRWSIRGIKSAISKIEWESQKMIIAIKGSIKKTYRSINYIILMNILKKKINDKNFLKLVESSLKQKVIFIKEKKKKKRIIEVPWVQERIINFILFNIYMYEFDKMIKNTVSNVLENKFFFDNLFFWQYKKLKSRIDFNKAKIKKMLKKKGSGAKNMENYKKWKNEKQIAKQKMMNMSYLYKKKCPLVFS